MACNRGLTPKHACGGLCPASVSNERSSRLLRVFLGSRSQHLDGASGECSQLVVGELGAPWAGFRVLVSKHTALPTTAILHLPDSEQVRDCVWLRSIGLLINSRCRNHARMAAQSEFRTPHRPWMRNKGRGPLPGDLIYFGVWAHPSRMSLRRKRPAAERTPLSGRNVAEQIFAARDGGGMEWRADRRTALSSLRPHRTAPEGVKLA